MRSVRVTSSVAQLHGSFVRLFKAFLQSGAGGASLDDPQLISMTPRSIPSVPRQSRQCLQCPTGTPTFVFAAFEQRSTNALPPHRQHRRSIELHQPTFLISCMPHPDPPTTLTSHPSPVLPALTLITRRVRGVKAGRTSGMHRMPRIDRAQGVYCESTVKSTVESSPNAADQSCAAAVGHAETGAGRSSGIR